MEPLPPPPHPPPTYLTSKKPNPCNFDFLIDINVKYDSK